jgi:hypothetical protein
MPQDTVNIMTKPNDATQTFSVAAASGSVDIPTENAVSITIAITQAAIVGGAAPTVTWTLFGVDPFNNEYSITVGAVIAAAGGQQLFQVGPGMGAAVHVFNKYRLKWATTGGPTTANVQISAAGATGGG